MDYKSRNEYLKSLNRMRSNYQNQGNPLINTEDDNGNVGNELSSFAYMNTDLQAPEQASKQASEDAGYKFGNAMRTVSNSLNKGAFEFLDTIGDWLLKQYGAISGFFGGIGSAIQGQGFEKGWAEGSDWARQAINYDWVSQATNFTDLTENWLYNLTSGDDYDWSSLGSAEASQQRLNNINKTGGIEGSAQYIEMAGQMLPEVAITVATFGASQAGSISKLGANLAVAGLSGATSSGRAIEKSTMESGKFGVGELGYSAIRGGSSALFSFGTSALGGQLGQSGGIVEGATSKFASMFSSSTARTIAKDVSEIATRVGFATGRAGIDQLLDPVIQTLTYDHDAIAKAYGEEYWEQFGKTLATTAVVATIASVATKGSQIVKEGGWQDHINTTDFNILSRGAMKVDKLRQQMYSKLDDIRRNGGTVADELLVMKDYLGKMEKVSDNLQKVASNVNKDYHIRLDDNSESTYSTGDMLRILDKGNMREHMSQVIQVLDNTPEFKGKFTKMAQYSNGDVHFTNGKDYFDVDADGNINLGTNVNGQNYVAKLTYHDGAFNFNTDTSSGVKNALIVIGNISDVPNLPTKISFDASKLNIPSTEMTSGELTISNKVMQTFLKNNKGESINFLQKLGKKKDNYVLATKNNEIVVVEPFKDGNVQKYGLVTIKKDTNKIVKINVKTDVPAIDKAYIVPKADETKLIDTKLLNKDGTAITYNNATVDYDWDISDAGEEYSANLKPSERADNNSAFVYSKNPLKVKELAKELPFSRLVKEFKVPASMEKTYYLKLNDKTNELALLRWVAKREHMTVEELLDKLGYDSIVKNDYSVTIFNPSNILKRGVEFRYGKRSENYSDLIKRNVSQNTIEELEVYVGENGRELETTKETAKYSRLIRETLSYYEKDIDFDGWTYKVKIINKDKYTPEMIRTINVARKIGVDVSFALKQQEMSFHDPLDTVSAYWTGGGKDIVIFVDSGRRGTLEQTAKHELGHAIFDRLHGRELTNFHKWIKTLEKKYPFEVLKKREYYTSTWNYDPTLPNYNDLIYEEMFCDTYAGLCEWKDEGVSHTIIKEMDSLYNKGTKVANKEYYEMLAEEESENYQETYLDRMEVSEPEKIISDKKAQSSNVLIEAGADVNKAVKYRIDSVKYAFNKALNEVVPDNGNFKLEFKDVKKSFAELNLAKPKDRATAIDNIMKRLKSTKIKLVTVFGEEKVKLGNVLTQAQEQEARSIMLSALNGKAEPTKLAKWAKALGLERLERKENIRTAKLLKSLNTRIKNSSKYTFGYGDQPTGELSVYNNIVGDVKQFFDNASISTLADNVLRYYTDDNIGQLFEYYNIQRNPMVTTLAQMIKDRVVFGKHLSPETIELGNDILQLLNNDLKYISQSSHDMKVELAKENVDVAQGIFGAFGNNDNRVPKILGKFGELIARLDTSIMSPASFVEAIFGKDAVITKHYTVEAPKCENNVIAKEAEFNDLFFKEIPEKLGISDISKELGKKITFKGEKLTIAQALKRINLEKTLGERFYKAKGSIVGNNGRRTDVVYTPEDIKSLTKLIPDNIIEWNGKTLHELTHGKIKDYIKSSYRRDTKTELKTMDNDGDTYYKVSRVSDKVLGIKKGGFSANDFDYSDLNERVPQSIADLNFNGDMISDLKSYIHRNVHRFEWGQWWKQMQVYWNQRVYGTTLNAIMQKNVVGWDNIVDLTIHTVLDIPYDTTKSLIGRVVGGAVGGIQRAMVLGLQTAVRTLSSRPWFASYFGAKYALAGELLNAKHGDMLAFKKNSTIIKEHSPYLKERFTSQEVVSAETSQRVSGKISKVLGTPLRLADASIIITYGFSCAQAQATEEGFGDPYTNSNNKRAVQILEEAVKRTQPTTSKLNVGGFRYGQYGAIIRQTFGMYASMVQSFYQGVRGRVYDMVFSKKYADNMDKTIKHHDDRMVHYQQEMDKDRVNMDNAQTDEEYAQAREQYDKDNYKYNEHKSAQERIKKHFEEWKKDHSGKAQFNKLAGVAGGLFFSALLYVTLNKLIKKVEGKEEWSDWSAEEIANSTAEQMLFRSFPYLSTLYYSIRNNSDMSVFTIDRLNAIVDSATAVYKALQSGNIGKISGSLLQALTNLSQFFGIPAQSMWKIVNGLWYNADKDSNLTFNTWLGNLSATSLKNNYKDGYIKGQQEKAESNLEVWLYNYSVPSSSQVIDEIYTLNNAGITNVAPSAYVTSYSDENGATVKLTASQVNDFRNIYNKSNAKVEELLNITDYKSLDNEAKGKLIKRIYTEYYNYAKSKVFGYKYTGKIAGLMEATNGDISLAKYILGLQQLSVITEDKKHSHKENVIKAINKMSGFTKSEKLLLAYLSGYSVSENNRARLTKHLMKLGFSKKDAKAYLGIQ